MERITNIAELSKGDKIVRINPATGRFEILEYREPHPHNPEYSLFINDTYDGAPKFYNRRLQAEPWYRYSEDAWPEIHQMEIKWHQSRITSLERRIEEEQK